MSDLADFVADMRDEQEDLYSTTGTLTRKSTAPGTFDPATAQTTRPTPTTVYAGTALVRPEGDSVAEVGEGSESLPTYIVKLPADTDAQVDDLWTSSASTYDADLVGLSLRVVHVFHDEWQIARKCRAVAEIPRGAA